MLTRVFKKERLLSWTRDVFVKLGVPCDDAAQVCELNGNNANTYKAAEVLNLSDLRGIDSHGVARMRTYYELMVAGKVNPKPKISIVRETISTATVDGDNGLGLVVGPKANRIALDKAETAGSGWVSVRNSNHYGIAGYYTLEAIKRDLIGFSMTNTTKLVVPLWGAEAMLGTNPLSVAFPGKNGPPIVIDMATSAVAYGKVEIAHRQNKKMPEGWCVDAEGEITTDPKEVIDGGGNLLPVGMDRERGAHKGYSLSIMADILSGLLSGANWGPFTPPFTLQRHFNLDPKVGTVGKGMGHFFGALKIDGFIDPDEFKEKVDEYRRVFKSTKPAKGTSGPLLPGDPEFKEEQKRREHGIPLIMPVVEDLKSIGTAVGVPLEE